MYKRHFKIGIAAICMITMMLTGCSNNGDAPEVTDKEPQLVESGITNELEKNNNWMVEQIALKSQSVSQVQTLLSGKLFVLSQGRIFSIDHKKEVKEIISSRENITAFYILTTDEGNLLFYGCSDGKLFSSALGEEEKEMTIDAFDAPINKITGNTTTGEVYVGQSSKYGGGLWKSQDQGKNWRKLTDTTVRGITIHPIEPNIIYIVDKQTYFSDDAGENFLKINTEANYGVLIADQYPDAAYHAYSSGVFITDKSGNKSGHLKFFLDGSMTRLEINPQNINHWLMGVWNYPSGVGGLYLSKNSGGVWQPIGSLDNIYVNDIAYSNNGKVAYIATKQNGIWAVNCMK